MASRRPDPDGGPRFFPRVTLTLAAGAVVFALATVIYSLPALLESPPPGAIPDYTRERVRARLEGKVPALLGGSLLAVAAVAGARSWRRG